MNPKHIFSFRAGEEISDHTLVCISTDGRVKKAKANDVVIGVSDWTTPEDAGVSVTTAGIARVRAGGTIVQGDCVTANADGAAVKIANGKYIGVATTNGSDGSLVDILLTKGEKANA